MFCFGLSPVAFVGMAAVTVTIGVDCTELLSLATDKSFDVEEPPLSAIGFPVALSCNSVGSPFSSGN
uniref:Putative secreted protein n=1 Tax=Anopheles triannulatus TaxID=58253 RepID=A0A2M4B491_9DIPT